MGLIVAVSKDPGGTNGILPVIRLLRKKGLRVLFLVNGWAKTKSLDEDDPKACDTLQDFLVMMGNEKPMMVITSMCSGGGLGRELAEYYRNKDTPVIALQDFPGARLKTDWKVTRPTKICVNDQEGKDLVKKAWPDFSEANILITGFPAMDKYAAGRRASLLAQGLKLRRQLGVPDDGKLILVTGQLISVDGLFGAVVGSLNRENVLTPDRIYLLASVHPKMDSKTATKCKKVLTNLKRGKLVDLSKWEKAHNRKAPFELFMSAADIVVAMYSSTLMEAVYLGKVAISVLYPETGQKLMEEETNHLLTEFPMVNSGLCQKVTTQEELDDLIHQALGGKDFIPPPFLGGNTERVVARVLEMLPIRRF